MSVANGSTIRVVAEFANTGPNVAQNTYFMRCSFSSTQTDAAVTAAVGSYLYRIYHEMRAELHSTLTPTRMIVDVVEFLAGVWTQVYQVYNGPWTEVPERNATTQLLPPAVSAVGLLRTSQGKHQGRKFFSGFTEGSNSVTGYLESVTVSRVAAALAQLVQAELLTSGNTLQYVIASPTTGALLEVIGYAVKNIWAYQRRRKHGKGS